MQLVNKKQAFGVSKLPHPFGVFLVVLLVRFWVTLPIYGQSRSATVLANSDSVSSGVQLYEYQADRIEEDFKTGEVILTGNVVLQYNDVELSAGRIRFNRKTQRLEAEPLADSTGAPTVGIPRFSRGQEEFSGIWILYNLDTGRGTVRGGRAVHQSKYFKGKQILVQSQKEMHARTISVSTCNRDHVHYDFLCNTLKVLENDKAIARSVTFRIGPVPLFWLPFYVFPLQQGRRSGILTPSLGSNSRDGFTVSNLGYYWAPSEYWDATVRTAIREHNGFRMDTQYRYNVRRRLSGDMDLSFENGRTGTGGSLRSWRLNFQHRQRLSPTTKIRGNGSFTSSSSFNQRNSNDLYQFLNRQLRSSFSLDKRWSDTGRSLDASVSYTRDLERDQNRFQGFPTLSFRQGRKRIFGVPDNASSRGQPWYKAFYYDFSAGLRNDFTRNPDATQDTQDLTVDSRVGVNSQHRPFGWLGITPRITLSQSSSRNDQNRPTRRETYSGAISSGTTLYGIFLPKIGRLRGLRHRLQPHIDFQYNQSATVDGGTFGFGGIRDWSDPRRVINLSLNNVLEIKTEVEGKDRRSTFASLNMRTGYDFDTSSPRNWRSLTTSGSVKPDRRVDVRLSMSHSFYNERNERSMLTPGLESITVTSNFRFRGQSVLPEDRYEGRNPLQSTGTDFNIERDLYSEHEDVSQPWRFNLSHYYSFRKASFAGSADSKRTWIKGDLGFNPTPSWRVAYSANYDLEDTRLTAQNLTIYRSLHCWEARFVWYPTGFNRGFYFRVNIKDIPQIKYEHRQGGYGL
ncbi:MAG TPA: hypothetical protein DIU35_06140 [Candidatus Latescibacteria bacterium]|nr:hypothetical protein [Candidatus Latescibacterota bacterium]